MLILKKAKESIVYVSYIKSYETRGLKITRFKLTPLVKLKTITVMIGEFECNELKNGSRKNFEVSSLEFLIFFSKTSQ